MPTGLGSSVLASAQSAGPETLGHILSSCKTYQWTLYKERHDQVLYQLVKAVTKSLGLMLPNRLRGAGGVVKSGVMGTATKRMLIDQAIPTGQSAGAQTTRPDDQASGGEASGKF